MAITLLFIALIVILLGLVLILFLVIMYLLLRRRQPSGEGGQGWDREKLYPPAEFFVQDELILAGPSSLIAGVAENPQVSSLIERLDRLDFSQFGERLKDCQGLPDGLVIDRYRITGAQVSVRQAIERLNAALGVDYRRVVKEPNWLTGHPFEAEGSPFEAEGSPFEAEGSSGGGMSPQADPGEFMRQWAFELIGLAQGKGRGEYSGRGVIVGLFDTSPYDSTIIPTDTWVAKTVQLEQAPSPLELGLFHPSQNSPTVSSAGAGLDVRNHGYFSSGLVQALAPGSQIRLLRVLENNNRGDLFTLLKAIFTFLLKDVPPVSAQNPGAVINLSLGVRVAPAEAGFGLPGELLALRYLLKAADCLGVVTAAAAGNNSARLSLPAEANTPASLSGVIGVAANNRGRQRACFSNTGKIAAPGGDGRGQDDPGCKPRHLDCHSGDCEWALIGPGVKPPYADENDNAYYYWAGTSFSTPLVSGLAALVLEAGGGYFSPSQVARLIACGAIPTGDPHLGAGVIHIGRTLELCAQARQA